MMLPYMIIVRTSKIVVEIDCRASTINHHLPNLILQEANMVMSLKNVM